MKSQIVTRGTFAGKKKVKVLFKIDCPCIHGRGFIAVLLPCRDMDVGYINGKELQKQAGNKNASKEGGSGESRKLLTPKPSQAHHQWMRSISCKPRCSPNSPRIPPSGKENWAGKAAPASSLSFFARAGSGCESSPAHLKLLQDPTPPSLAPPPLGEWVKCRSDSR